jgi:NADPH2:quinone reductase
LAGDIPRVPLNLPLLKGADIQGVFWGSWIERNPARHRDNIRALFDLYERGAIRPHVSALYPFAQAPDALGFLASRQATGKVVVTMP